MHGRMQSSYSSLAVGGDIFWELGVSASFVSDFWAGGEEDSFVPVIAAVVSAVEVAVSTGDELAAATAWCW